jgi:predicted metal-dependent TIM-barrel fold hydrolase
MAKAGIVGVVEPAFWLGQPRTQVGSFIDYFNALLGWERFRAKQFGIAHYCTIGLNPKEANDPRLADPVMELMPRFLEKDGVVAVGEIGFDDITPAEERVFARQMELAKNADLPVLIHTPHRDKKKGTERTLAVVRESGVPEERVLIDHNNEETLPLVRQSGCWAGHSVYPETKLTESRMVDLLKRYGLERMVVNSAADWGKSDPLKVPKTADAMRAAGFSEADVERVLFENPVCFFEQSGRLNRNDMLSPHIDQAELYEGNSVLRGQVPRKS